MAFFRKYKTFEQISTAFLFEKETSILPRSYKSYVRNIEVFQTWLEDHDLHTKPIRKIKSEDIKKFFNYLGKERRLDKSTCEKYFLSLRKVFTYAELLEELEYIPFKHVVFPLKKKDQSADVISDDDLKLLLTTIESTDKQLYLACMIQYYCFIRPGKELRLLKIGDIHLRSGILVVQQENSKNRKRQTVTITKQLAEILKEYGVNKAEKSLYVFGKKKRFNTTAVSVNMLRYRFNKVRDMLGLSKRYKFYSLKHTGATRLHVSGVSMFELMSQLRHSKLESTQHYLKKCSGVASTRIRDNFPSPYEV